MLKESRDAETQHRLREHNRGPMCWRRRDATRRLDTHSFPPPWLLAMAMIFFCVSLVSATESDGIQIYGTGGHSDDHWRQASGADSTLRLRPTPNSGTKLMQVERRMARLRKRESPELETSINRILDSKSEAGSIDVETRNGLTAKPEELDSTENEKNENSWPLDLESVGKRKTRKDNISQSNKSRSSKTEAKEGFASLQLNDNNAPFDPESATFSPDKVLVDVEKRLNEGKFDVAASEEAVYITDEEAAKLGQKKHPIRPLMVNPAELPAGTDSEYEVIPHTLSKSPQRIDLISRKLFVRNDTDAKLSKKQRRHLSNDILIKNQKNFSHDNKTVKKDLSRSIDGEHYENDIAGSLSVPETLSVHHSTSLKSTITRNNSKLTSNEKTFENRTTHLNRNASNHQISDVMTVEEFKAHWWQNGTWGNRPPATSVDQTRILDQDKVSNDDGAKRIKNDSSDSKASEEYEKENIPHRISYVKNHLDVPVASKIKGMVDGSGRYQLGNFHQPFPNIESIYGDSFRRKRSAHDIVPMIRAAKERDVN